MKSFRLIMLCLIILLCPQAACSQAMPVSQTDLEPFEVIDTEMPPDKTEVLTTSGVGLSARAAVVLESKSGRVLFKKNMTEKMGMASTTKIMTAIVALKYGNLSDKVTVSSNAAMVEGSSMHLSAGEEISLESLLYGLMLVSGNDAATAIAEHISGSVEKFAELMNKTAEEFGAVNTHFTNPHGLDNPEHYTTAYDLALITSHGLKIPKFAEIVKTKTKKVPWQGKDYNRLLTNHNKMLNLYEGSTGVKTGFTKKTGRCLVSSANRNNMEIIAVTLNAPSDWSDHKRMLDSAFGTYKNEKIADRNTKYGELIVNGGTQQTVNLVAAEDFLFPLANGEIGKLKITAHIPESLKAPVREGQAIGNIGISIDGIEYVTYPLMAENEVLLKNIFYGEKDGSYTSVLQNTLGEWLKIPFEKNE